MPEPVAIAGTVMRVLEGELAGAQVRVERQSPRTGSLVVTLLERRGVHQPGHSFFFMPFELEAVSPEMARVVDDAFRRILRGEAVIVCPRCVVAVPEEKLLDGEACPRCKLVL